MDQDVTRDLMPGKRPPKPGDGGGVNHLLVIGIDAYAHWKKLNNAVRDAAAFRDLLQQQFDFEADRTRYLFDDQATKDAVLEALRDHEKDGSRALTPADNLIIYFSGHGAMNPNGSTGYWIPFEAPGSTRERHKFISNTDLKESLEHNDAHHIYIISDACFSGSLVTRSAGDEKLYENKRSRRVLTSGQLEKVFDGKPGGHSPFAAALLECLRSKNTNVFSAELEAELLRVYQQKVRALGVKPEDIPRLDYAHLTDIGHDSGQFVFHPKRSEARDWEKAQSQNTRSAYEAFLAAWPDGQFTKEAKNAIRGLAATAFEAATASGDPEQLRKFLRENPGSIFEADGIALLQNIQDERDWAEACRVDTEHSYNRYREKQPQGRYWDEALQRSKAKIEERDWLRVKQFPEIADLDQFMRKHPQGVFFEEAKTLRNTLKENAEREAKRLEEDQKRAAAREAERLAQLELERQKAEQLKQEQAELAARNAQAAKEAEARAEEKRRQQEAERRKAAEKKRLEEEANKKSQVENQKIPQVEGARNIHTLASTSLVKKEYWPAITGLSLILLVALGLGVKAWLNSDKNRNESPPQTAQLNAPAALETSLNYTDPYAGAMVAVKGGTFQMGSNEGDSDEKPVHSVTVGDFWTGQYEVTQKQWRAIMGSDPPELAFPGCDQCPVERVSWNDIQEFIQKLNAKTGHTYRLPTEAEWEYAAGGGSSNRTKWAGTNSESSLGNYAWYDANSGSKTHPVGEKQPNALGLYDMSGNVWEWCGDWYGENYYQNSELQNPKGPNNREYRVLRGGSWNYDSIDCRVADRVRNRPSNRVNSLGFRLARDLR